MFCINLSYLFFLRFFQRQQQYTHDTNRIPITNPMANATVKLEKKTGFNNLGKKEINKNIGVTSNITHAAKVTIPKVIAIRIDYIYTTLDLRSIGRHGTNLTKAADHVYKKQ